MAEKNENEGLANLPEGPRLKTLLACLAIAGAVHYEVIDLLTSASIPTTEEKASANVERKKNEFLQGLVMARITEAVASRNGSDFVFQAEKIDLEGKYGEEGAGRRVELAQMRFNNLVKELGAMKDKDKDLEEILNYVLQFFGKWKTGSTFLTNLLVDGEGNCSARAKLSSKSVKKVYGDEVKVLFMSTNIRSPKAGDITPRTDEVTPKIDEITPHVRSVVVHDGKYYLVELPKVRVLSEAEFRAKFDGCKLTGEDELVDAYMVKQGVITRVETEESPATKKPNTDDIFSFGVATNVEEGGVGEVVDGDPAAMNRLGADGKFKVRFVEKADENKADPNKVTREDIEQWFSRQNQHLPEGVKIFDDPEVAGFLVGKLKEKEIASVDCRKFQKISDPVLEVLGQLEGEFQFSFPDMDANTAAVLGRSKIVALSLHKLGKLKPGVTKELAKFQGDYIDLSGLDDLSVEDARSLVEVKTLVLDVGVKRLTPDVAPFLALFKGKVLRLILESLGLEEADMLSQFEGPRLSLFLRDPVDSEVFGAISKFKVGMLDLDLPSLDIEAAKDLLKFKGKINFLGRRAENFSDEVIELLEKSGNVVSLPRRKNITLDHVDSVTGKDGVFNRFKELKDVDVARALIEKFKGGELNLEGVDVSKEVLDILGQFEGTRLYLALGGNELEDVKKLAGVKVNFLRLGLSYIDIEILNHLANFKAGSLQISTQNSGGNVKREDFMEVAKKILGDGGFRGRFGICDDNSCTTMEKIGN